MWATTSSIQALAISWCMYFPTLRSWLYQAISYKVHCQQLWKCWLIWEDSTLVWMYCLGSCQTFQTRIQIFKYWISKQGSSAGLVGNIPETLANLPFLSTLALAGNQLSGSIPPVLGNMGQLRVLNLSSNKLNQFIPKEFGKLGEFVLILHVHFVYSVMMLCLTHLCSIFRVSYA